MPSLKEKAKRIETLQEIYRRLNERDENGTLLIKGRAEQNRVIQEDILKIFVEVISPHRRRVEYERGKYKIVIDEISAQDLTEAERSLVEESRKSYEVWGEVNPLLSDPKLDFSERTKVYIARVYLKANYKGPDDPNFLRGLTMRFTDYDLFSDNQSFDALTWDIAPNNYPRAQDETQKQPLVEGLQEYYATENKKDATYRVVSRISALRRSRTPKLESIEIMAGIVLLAASYPATFWLGTMRPELVLDTFKGEDGHFMSLLLQFERTQDFLREHSFAKYVITLDHQNPAIKELKCAYPGYWVTPESAKAVLVEWIKKYSLTAEQIITIIKKGNTKLKEDFMADLNLREIINFLTIPANMIYLVPLLTAKEGVSLFNSEEITMASSLQKLWENTSEAPFSSFAIPENIKLQALQALILLVHK